MTMIAPGVAIAAPAGAASVAMGPALWRAAAIVGAGMLHAALFRDSGDLVTNRVYESQDFGWLALFVVFYAAMARAPAPRCEGVWNAIAGPRQGPFVALLIVLAGLVAFLGLRLFLWNYFLSRDENFAEFDATIFGAGRLIAPFPSEWRSYYEAFSTYALLPVPNNAGWVSNYLPVNAATRALAGLAGDRMLANAFIAVLALAMIHALARKLWPARSDAALVAVVLVALSPQFLVTAMTPFAMTAHLALNAAWLLLFLRGGVAGHAGAAATGFLATGLHQLVFHPLFVAPFVVTLLARRRFGVALWYVAAYAAIGLFWIEYFKFAQAREGVATASAGAAGLPLLVEKLRMLLDDFSAGALRAMDRNLLRFIGWQHLLALPLVVAGFSSMKRADDVTRALAAGLALNFAVMFVLMPHQGYGWGYRYWHGLIVGVALLATHGWIVLTEGAAATDATRARRLFVFASAVTLFALLPTRVWQARAYIEPFAMASRAIAAADADVVLVDPTGHRMAFDLVRNDPFLRNRPIILDATFVRPEQVADLCGRFRVSLFEASRARVFGIPEHESEPEAIPLAAAVRAELRRLSCGAPLPLPAGRG